MAKVRDVVGRYMNPPGHALVYALNTATIGGTALTGNHLISEISACVIGTPSTIGKFVLPLTNRASRGSHGFRLLGGGCAGRPKQEGGPHPRGGGEAGACPHKPGNSA
jgi:hypothetical protein